MKKGVCFFFIICGIMGYSQIPKSGNYGALDIAIDSVSKTIRGYYDNRTGENGQFSCVFFLTGTFKSFSDKSILINTFFPGESTDNIKGIVNCKANNEFSILLNDDHGGCWNVQTFKEDPVEFVLQKNEAWIDIKVIKNNKSYFYSEPDETKKCKTYVINGDCVKVLKRSGSWIKVVYESKTNTVGWIKTQDCY